MNDCTETRSSEQIHAEVAQAWDRYISILGLRDAEKDPVVWRNLNHEQQLAFQKWLHLQDRAMMHSETDAYWKTQKLGG